MSTPSTQEVSDALFRLWKQNLMSREPDETGTPWITPLSPSCAYSLEREAVSQIFEMITDIARDVVREETNSGYQAGAPDSIEPKDGYDYE